MIEEKMEAPISLIDESNTDNIYKINLYYRIAFVSTI